MILHMPSRHLERVCGHWCFLCLLVTRYVCRCRNVHFLPCLELYFFLGVISYCYYQMIWRWWSLKEWSGKNHPVRKKHGSFGKVGLTLCPPLPFSSLLFSHLKTLEILSTWIADYSGGHAATVGSVLVTNLKTGFSKGEWDRGEVPYAFIALWNSL